METENEERRETPGKPRRRRWTRVLAWMLFLALVAGAAATFPEGWGPRLAVWGVRRYLPHGVGYENELAVSRIGLTGVKAGPVRLGGFPTAPALETIEIRYTLGGLLRKRIDRVSVAGLSFRPEYAVTNFTLPAKAFAGEIVVYPDPLQGWSVDLIEGETAEIDFGGVLAPQAQVFFPSATMRARFRVERGAMGYAGRLDGDILGGDVAARLDYAPETRRGNVVATLSPRLAPADALPPGDLTARIGFEVTSQGGYGVRASGDIAFADESVVAEIRADVAPAGVDIQSSVARRQITEKTPIMATMLSLAEIPPSITDIAFSAAANANFRLTVTNALPQWTLEAGLRDGTASMKSGDIPMSLGGASCMVRLKGVGPHFDVLPMPMSFTNAALATVSLDAGRAFLLADQESLVISEGSIGFCGGFIRLYALYLSFKRLSTGFTVFIDGVEVEKFLTMFPELAGTTATGRLFGRIPLYIFQNGSEIRLRDSFLYTPPGDTGRICVGDAARVEELLVSGGLPKVVAGDLAKALRNLDYTVLRLDLRQPEEGGEGKLTLRLKGESREGRTITPVDLNISLNGTLESALNLAIRTAKLKGK